MSQTPAILSLVFLLNARWTGDQLSQWFAATLAAVAFTAWYFEISDDVKKRIAARRKNTP